MKVSIKCTGSLAARILAALPKDLKAATLAAEKENLQTAKGELVKATSGTNSKADLRRAGHPYAKRAPNSAFDPAIANTHSGQVPAGWVMTEPSESGDTLTGKAANNTESALWLARAGHGNSTSVARPIVQGVKAKVREPRTKRVRAAVHETITKASTTT